MRETDQPPVVFVTRKWAPAVGGMETYSMRLCEQLAVMRETIVIALRGRENGMPPSAARLAGFPLVAARRLWRLQAKPSVLHLGDMAIWPLALLARLCSNPPVVLSAHGTDVAYHRRGGLKGRLYGAYLKLGARLLRNARVIANSHATAAVLAETGWRASAIVPLATDLVAGDADGLHDGRLLFVGRLVERKGAGWFISEVLPRLPETIALDIAGTGWSESEKAMLRDPRVRFLGPLHGDALTAAYRRALAVVIPNIPVASGEYEGFGLVAPEAAAAGGLVLAARCDGLRDAVVDGKSGTLLPPGDADAWVDAIERMVRLDPQQRLAMVQTAQDTARMQFGWDRVAMETLAIYGTCVRKA